MPLTKDRNTPEKAGVLFEYPVATGVKIFAGAIVCLNASGYAVPASTATTLKVIGRAEELADNSGGSNGDINVKVKRGVFLYKNSASGDAITLAEVGAVCYLVDDETVAKTSGTNTRSRAGYVVDVETAGVWVLMGLSILSDPSGALLSASNLSDLANAATARANLGVAVSEIELDSVDLVGANTAVYRKVLRGAGTISKITSIIDKALTVGDATITAAINGTPVTTGAITVTQDGSDAGDIDAVSPSALNTFTDGQVLTLTVGGTNTAEALANVRIDVTR